MKSVADKAYQLSVKCDLSDQANLIQFEMQELSKRIQEKRPSNDLEHFHLKTVTTPTDKGVATPSVKYMDNLMVDHRRLHTSIRPFTATRKRTTIEPDEDDFYSGNGAYNLERSANHLFEDASKQ